MIIKEIEDRELWEKSLLSFERRTFLDSWNWGEFRKKLGDKVWRRGVFEDGRITGASLVSRIDSRKGDFLLLAHSPITESGDSFKAALKDIITIAKKERVQFVRLAPVFENGSLEEEMALDLGFRKSPSSVFPTKSLEVDLSPNEESILLNMRKSTRYLIRKGSKDSGMSVSLSSDPRDLSVFCDLYSKTASRQGFNPFSKDYLEKEFRSFSSDGEARIILGYHGDDCLAGAFVVFWGGRAFYHHGASLSVSNDIPLAHLVQWEAIKEAKRRGCEKYNLWAISPSGDPKHKWAGLTRFKRGFGGDEIDYADTMDLPLSKKYLVTYWFERLRS